MSRGNLSVCPGAKATIKGARHPLGARARGSRSRSRSRGRSRGRRGRARSRSGSRARRASPDPAATAAAELCRLDPTAFWVRAGLAARGWAGGDEQPWHSSTALHQHVSEPRRLPPACSSALHAPTLLSLTGPYLEPEAALRASTAAGPRPRPATASPAGAGGAGAGLPPRARHLAADRSGAVCASPLPPIQAQRACSQPGAWCVRLPITERCMGCPEELPGAAASWLPALPVHPCPCPCPTRHCFPLARRQAPALKGPHPQALCLPPPPRCCHAQARPSSFCTSAACCSTYVTNPCTAPMQREAF